MKKQVYIVEIDMPDGDLVSSGWLQGLIQQDLDSEEDKNRQTVSVREIHLPSNLDEAAVSYANRLATDAIDHELIKGYFRTGAEWMAGQGISAESEVCKLAGRAWIKPVNEKQFELDVYDNFVSDDKVIVQIRKK